MAKFILVSREKEDLYVNVDQVRVLRPQSGGGGTTIVFDLEHTMTVFGRAPLCRYRFGSP
jgi:hypothetical protein